jgi:hypothetical protein
MNLCRDSVTALLRGRKAIIMRPKSNQALGFTAMLVLLGLLSFYGGAHWFGLLIPAALLVWLAGAIRCRGRNSTLLDDRVDNRN